VCHTQSLSEFDQGEDGPGNEHDEDQPDTHDISCTHSGTLFRMGLETPVQHIMTADDTYYPDSQQHPFVNMTRNEVNHKCQWDQHQGNNKSRVDPERIHGLDGRICHPDHQQNDDVENDPKQFRTDQEIRKLVHVYRELSEDDVY